MGGWVGGWFTCVNDDGGGGVGDRGDVGGVVPKETEEEGEATQDSEGEAGGRGGGRGGGGGRGLFGFGWVGEKEAV